MQKEVDLQITWKGCESLVGNKTFGKPCYRYIYVMIFETFHYGEKIVFEILMKSAFESMLLIYFSL